MTFRLFKPYFMRRTFYVFLALVLTVLLSGCSLVSDIREAQHKSDVPITTKIGDDLEELNLDVPFYSQAPQGDWGMPYQEACEEASLLLAYYYVTDQSPTIEEFEEDLLAMVDWEVSYFGQYEHTTIEQTAEIASVYLGWDDWEIVDDPTAEQLKSYLSEGYPIVAPFAGRYLGNPYFTGAGPVYHMLVIRGYDHARFITNDVGTRHGENFLYAESTLLNALHDWHDAALTDDEGITQGSKRVLVVRPN